MEKPIMTDGEIDKHFDPKPGKPMPKKDELSKTREQVDLVKMRAEDFAYLSGLLLDAKPSLAIHLIEGAMLKYNQIGRYCPSCKKSDCYDCHVDPNPLHGVYVQKLALIKKFTTDMAKLDHKHQTM